MKIVISYISPNGTTRATSKEIGYHFLNSGHEVLQLDIGRTDNRDYTQIDWSIYKDADLVGIGSPVYHLSIFDSMHEFLEIALPKIYTQNPKIKAFLFITYAGITSGRALLNAALMLKKNNIGVVGALKIKAPHFWDSKCYPDDNAIEAVKGFYNELFKKDFNIIPLEKIKNIFSVKKTKVKLIYPLAGIIGSKRKLPINFIDTKCIKCKKCSNECPVNAISINEYAVRDLSKCAYCYHCTWICPKDAIEFNVEKIKNIVNINKRIVGQEEPQNEIFV